MLGALAAAPQAHHLTAAMPKATARTARPGQVASAPSPASARDGSYRPQRARQGWPARPASAEHAAGPARTPARRHHRSAASKSRSSGHQGGGAVAGGTLRCTGSAGMLPANYAAIVGFLTAHGYTGIAAAGIAGNIYQESMGNPESVGSGGGGLIGWTPLPAGFVTGDPAADLQTQLEAILTFNQQWAQYIPP
jgi:Phage tail lysozyme